jgi:hypothetical protein
MEWMPRKTREGRGREVFLFGNPTKINFGAVGATGTNHPNSTGHMQSIFFTSTASTRQMYLFRCIPIAASKRKPEGQEDHGSRLQLLPYQSSPSQFVPSSSSNEREVCVHVCGRNKQEVIAFFICFQCKTYSMEHVCGVRTSKRRDKGATWMNGETVYMLFIPHHIDTRDC